MENTRNYEVLATEDAVPVKTWTLGVPFEQEAKAQLLRVAKLPFIHKWVAAMPDVHLGKGATIGSVIPTHKAIVPAAVGVDIGCGMMAAKTSLKAKDLPDNLKNIRTQIERAVPHGRGSFGEAPDAQRAAFGLMSEGFQEIKAKHPKAVTQNPMVQLGTLGTGNHFIELCLDENDDVWIMLHSGSRGVGNAIGTYFIELAKKDMKKWMVNLPDQDLAYLPEGTDHFDDYVSAVAWAQNYARMNRELMMQQVIAALKSTRQLPEFVADVMAVNCHHNYVQKEHHYGENVFVTRKGAVSAKRGELGIIPGSMGAKSFIVRGLGNEESFHSCSHGAGRSMSRTAAKKKFSVADHAEATLGVECRKDADVIDETPAAYKNIDAVMHAQRDLVEVVHTLKQVVCVKG